MSTISMYPKTWAKYQQELLNLADPHGMILLNSNYTFDALHRNYGDIPQDAIVGEAVLATIQYEGANDRFTVSDGTFRQVVPEEEAVAVILYRMDEYEDDSRVVLYSDDITGLPLTTSGADITISFPDGILVLAPSGYTTPSISVAEEAGMSTFDAQINEDIANNMMNPEEFGTTIQYTHANTSNSQQYTVMKTATPENVTLVDVDMNSITQTIKMQNSDLRAPARRGDKVLMEGVAYNVAGALAENYTTDVFLQTTQA